MGDVNASQSRCHEVHLESGQVAQSTSPPPSPHLVMSSGVNHHPETPSPYLESPPCLYSSPRSPQRTPSSSLSPETTADMPRLDLSPYQSDFDIDHHPYPITAFPVTPTRNRNLLDSPVSPGSQLSKLPDSSSIFYNLVPSTSPNLSPNHSLPPSPPMSPPPLMSFSPTPDAPPSPDSRLVSSYCLLPSNKPHLDSSPTAELNMSTTIPSSLDIETSTLPPLLPKQAHHQNATSDLQPSFSPHLGSSPTRDHIPSVIPTSSDPERLAHIPHLPHLHSPRPIPISDLSPPSGPLLGSSPTQEQMSPDIPPSPSPKRNSSPHPSPLQSPQPITTSVLTPPSGPLLGSSPTQDHIPSSLLPSLNPQMTPSSPVSTVCSPKHGSKSELALQSCPLLGSSPTQDFAPHPPKTSIKLPGASPRFQELLEGVTEPGDSGNSTEPPYWLNRELFDRGRNFYRRYLFCLSFSNLLTLVLMLSMKNALQPLMYTGKSDTPFKALRRYMSTFLHLITWFKGDVWDPEDPAYKDILTVRRTHAKIASNVNSKDYMKVVTMSVKDKGYKEPSEPLHPSITQDFGAATNARLPEPDPDTHQFFSQFDMSLTQHSFMGLILAHPEKLGAASATEEDFEGLLHFWRGLGYLLGIEDRYNFCKGTVQEVRSLSVEVERLFGIPGLASAGWDYEHMASVLVNGMGYVLHILSYQSMLRYLAYTIDVPVPNISKRMTFQHIVRYWLMRVVFGFIYLVPQILSLFNSKIENLMDIMKTSSKLKIAGYRKDQAKVTEGGKCPFS